MKRWLVRIFVFLLLGTIVNVAVAWGSSLWSFWGLNYDSVGKTQQHELLARYATIPSGGFVHGGQRNDPGVARINVYFIDNVVQSATVEVAVIVAGLPQRCLNGACYRVGIPSPPATDRTVVMDGALRVNAQKLTKLRVGWNRGMLSDRVQMLPCRVIWPGFAINTVFYAVIVWLLFAGPFVLRRRRRIRRGLCPKCAYDLRGSKDASACPECGSIVPS